MQLFLSLVSTALLLVIVSATPASQSSSDLGANGMKAVHSSTSLYPNGFFATPEMEDRWPWDDEEEDNTHKGYDNDYSKDEEHRDWNDIDYSKDEENYDWNDRDYTEGAGHYDWDDKEFKKNRDRKKELSAKSNSNMHDLKITEPKPSDVQFINAQGFYKDDELRYLPVRLIKIPEGEVVKIVTDNVRVAISTVVETRRVIGHFEPLGLDGRPVGPAPTSA
ncbi:hypothetical protein EDC96DRAFT_574901 [Choanephora cucurbitarum]|nr:hypothetical protein EDC96DRAFT_574901 [Choanephora cucurbitarum]